MIGVCVCIGTQSTVVAKHHSTYVNGDLRWAIKHKMNIKKSVVLALRLSDGLSSAQAVCAKRIVACCGADIWTGAETRDVFRKRRLKTSHRSGSDPTLYRTGFL